MGWGGGGLKCPATFPSFTKGAGISAFELSKAGGGRERKRGGSIWGVGGEGGKRLICMQNPWAGQASWCPAGSSLWGTAFISVMTFSPSNLPQPEMLFNGFWVPPFSPATEGKRNFPRSDSWTVEFVLLIQKSCCPASCLLALLEFFLSLVNILPFTPRGGQCG